MMNQYDTILAKIGEDDFYTGPLTGLVEWAQKIVESIPEDQRHVVMVEPDGGGYSGEFFRLEIYRPATEDDIVAAKEKDRQWQENRERKLLETLTKKYGVSQ